jgi:hypothetical protein
MVDLHGPMLQRPDLLALAPAIRGFVERKRDDVLLASLGGSLRLMLRRSEYGSLSGEAWFSRGRISQSIVFGLWQEALAPALEGAERTARRLKDAQWGWTPSAFLDGDALLPRDSGIDEEAQADRPPRLPALPAG